MQRMQNLLGRADNPDVARRGRLLLRLHMHDTWARSCTSFVVPAQEGMSACRTCSEAPAGCKAVYLMQGRHKGGWLRCSRGRPYKQVGSGRSRGGGEQTPSLLWTVGAELLLQGALQGVQLGHWRHWAEWQRPVQAGVRASLLDMGWMSEVRSSGGLHKDHASFSHGGWCDSSSCRSSS